MRSISTAATALLILLAAAPLARAQPEMPSIWHSDSLRDNDIGYHFTLQPVPGAVDRYIGTFRFTHRDGRRISDVPISMIRRGDQLTFRATRGSFDRSAGPLRGLMDAGESRIVLTNCQARLRLVMSFALDSDCVFRPAKG